MSELGTKLREARVAKGLTLNSLQQTTKIQKKYLEAIEEGRFEDIPGTFYARGFVKQYADVVGLNGDDLLLEYQEEMEASQYVTEVDVPEEESELPSRLNRAREHQSNTFVDRVIPYFPFISLATAVILVMVWIVFAINKTNKSERAIESSVSESLSLVASVSPNATAGSAEQQSQVSKMEIEPGDIELGPEEKLTLLSSDVEETTYRLYEDVNRYSIEVRGEGVVWVGIFEDDQIVTDTVINAGEKVTYQMPNTVKATRIRIGYPEGAKIYVNNKEIPIKSLYFSDSILFLKPTEEFKEEASSEVSESTTETAGEQGFQGPAVLDPSNTTSEE